MGSAGMVIGILCLIGLGVGFIPCLGWLNWVNIPLAILGLIFSGIGLGQPDPERSKAVGGMVMCIIAICIGLIRLILGGGVF